MQYELNENVAVLRFDDGKANVVSHAFIDALYEGLDRAEKEAGAVIISGREGMFSGGFDLEELKKGAEATAALARRFTGEDARQPDGGRPLDKTAHAIPVALTPNNVGMGVAVSGLLRPGLALIEV